MTRSIHVNNGWERLNGMSMHDDSPRPATCCSRQPGAWLLAFNGLDEFTASHASILQSWIKVLWAASGVNS
jgi:hypothetical protein